MNLKDIAVVRAYHHERIKRFGIEASEALGWKTRDNQQRRFQQLVKIGNVRGRSVLDIGCGHGDLYPFLLEKYGEVIYTGIDNVSAFLEVAVHRFVGAANARFLLGDFSAITLPRSDYVICCGALNYRSSEPDHIYNMIDKFFAATTIGLGLNLLQKVDFSDGILVHFEMEQVVTFCRQLTSQVQLIVNPEDDHYTLFLYRE